MAVAGCILLGIGCLPVLYAKPQYAFDNVRQESQFQHLLKSLRCVVCQNQDLDDSHAPLAVELRERIYHMVLAGESDQAIMDFLVARYGDFILFKPPMRGITILLWFGPAIFLLSGCFFYVRYYVQRGAHG